MPVLYNNDAVIPAPLVEINRGFDKSANGEIIGQRFTISLNGTLIATRGSPNSVGVFYNGPGDAPIEVLDTDAKLKAIFQKQEALRELFSQEGHILEFTTWNGYQGLTCQPRILNISFPQGIWVEVCPYTITLETDQINGLVLPSGEIGFDEKLVDANESWALEFADQGENENQTNIFRLTHNLSAVGKRYYDPNVGTGPGSLQREPWEHARLWCQRRLGIDNNRILSSGTLNLPSYYQGFNHSRGENVDKQGGSYSIQETWVVSSGDAIEDFTIESRQSQLQGITVVSIQGQIQGLETRDSDFALINTKYQAASGKFNSVLNSLISRAQNYAGLAVNPTPLELSIARNPINGVISYSYTYDTRPSNCIAGAKSESIQIIDNHPTDIFAIIPILGRAAGPILQSINTISEKSRTLSIEAVMTPISGCGISALTGAKPNVQGLIDLVRPVANQVFVSQNGESWDVKNARYSRNVSWVYQ